MALHLQLAPAVEDEQTLAQDLQIRVVLAANHPLMRRGLRQLLDREHDVVVSAEAGELATAARLVVSEHPQVLVMDLGMPDASSLEAIGYLRELAPKTQIVVLTSEDQAVFAQRAFAAGALGLVTKMPADGELAQAILAASRGEQYISPPLATRLRTLDRGLTESKLSPREVEVLRMIALGHTSVEIARKLGLSPRTIETHRAHICTKLDVSTRAELVRYALQRRLIGA
jgi:two-component system, NarL family, response regulator NreC